MGRESSGESGRRRFGDVGGEGSGGIAIFGDGDGVGADEEVGNDVGGDTGGSAVYGNGSVDGFVVDV